MPFAHHLTDLADVLLATAEGGELRVNLGNVTTGDGYATDVPVWGPDGYLARPNDAADGAAARALYMIDGHNRRVFAFSDNRFAAQAGTLEPGDRMIVSDSVARIYLKRAKSQVGFYTEAESDNGGGKGMVIDLDGSSGVVQIRKGNRFVVIDDNGISLVCAGQTSQSSIVMTDTTITITAGTVNIAGGFVCLGLNSDGSLPGKPGLDTVLYGVTGPAAAPSPKVFVANY